VPIATGTHKRAVAGAGKHRPAVRAAALRRDRTYFIE
jgi:hypothetical protein